MNTIQRQIIAHLERRSAKVDIKAHKAAKKPSDCRRVLHRSTALYQVLFCPHLDQNGTILASSTQSKKMNNPTIQLHTVSQSLSVASSWQLQFAAVFAIVTCFATFFVWNYFYLPSPMFCTAEPVPEWTNIFTFLVVGATSGTTLQLWFRTIITMTGFTNDKLRHPYATWLVLFISSTQTLTQIANQIGFVPYTCVDFLGIKTHSFLWWEWLSTVPFMFFLVSIMDVKRNNVTSTDIWIEVLGGSSIFLCFDCDKVLQPGTFDI